VRWLILTAAVGAGLASRPSEAAFFDFGGGRSGVLNAPSAAITKDGLTLNLLPTIPGSLLNEQASAGLGVNSQNLPDANDDSPTASRVDINVLGGTGPLAGLGEGVEFSFDRPGVLTEIDFDGVKDESLEYFRLESAGGLDLFFFDSAANPGAIDVPGRVVFLQEEEGNSFIDDKTFPLAIPFAAGQAFTLTFGTLPSAEAANGARLQSLTAVAVPEPAAWLLAAATLPSLRRRR